MEIFEIAELAARQGVTGRAYLEFLRKDSMSVGLYRLTAGGTDTQQPHTEDEAYFVASGRGSVTVGDHTAPVQPGSFIFVGANVPHHFHNIQEELNLLVFFAPAEYANAGKVAFS